MTDEPPPSRRGALIALLVIAVLVGGTLLVQRVLLKTSITEDCLMAGRKNCAPVGNN